MVRRLILAALTTVLALPPREGTMRAYPGDVYLTEPLDLILSTYVIPRAPLSLRLTAFSFMGSVFHPDSPFLDTLAGLDGGVRLHLQAPSSTYGDLSAGDWMEFQTFYWDIANLRVLATNTVRITAR